MRDVCVVFDVDDTLYLETDYVMSGFNAVGQWAADWLSIPDFAERCWNRFIAGQRGRYLMKCYASPANSPLPN